MKRVTSRDLNLKKHILDGFLIEDNKPSLGYVRWSDVHITYMGQTYNIANGYTNKKYIYWKMSVSTTNFVVSDNFPELADEDVLVFYNRNGIHITVPTAQVTPGDLIVPGSILSSAIATGAITAEHLAAESVTAEAIAANAIGAEAIAAGAVIADKIATGAITTDKINSKAITTDKIAVGAITAASAILADASIVDAKIANGTITNAKIANLDAAKITTGTLSADRIGANSIVLNKLADETQRLLRNNLLDLSGWKKCANNAEVAAALVPSFITSMSGTANSVTTIDFDNTPYGQDLVMTTEHTVLGVANWMGATYNQQRVPIDHTKLYRITCWVRKTAQGHASLYVYFGADTASRVATLGTTVANTNFYFTNRTMSQLDLNTWYLFVGYIYPSDYLGNIHLGGIYTSDGKKVATCTSCKWMPGITDSGWRISLYCNNATYTIGTKLQFYAPTFTQIANGIDNLDSFFPGTAAKTTAMQDLMDSLTTLDGSTTVIDGGKIKTGSVTALQIASGSITANKVASNAITADKIATDAIKSRNYAESGGNVTAGSFLNLTDGSYKSKNTSWDSDGTIMTKSINIQGGNINLSAAEDAPLITLTTPQNMYSSILSGNKIAVAWDGVENGYMTSSLGNGQIVLKFISGDGVEVSRTYLSGTQVKTDKIISNVECLLNGTLSVAGNSTFGAIDTYSILPRSSYYYDLGSSNNRWSNIYTFGLHVNGNSYFDWTTYFNNSTWFNANINARHIYFQTDDSYEVGSHETRPSWVRCVKLAIRDYINGTTGITGVFRPANTTGTQDLGSTSNRWRTLFCTTAINTSDSSCKNDIRYINSDPIRVKSMTLSADTRPASLTNGTIRETNTSYDVTGDDVLDLIQQINICTYAFDKVTMTKEGEDEVYTKTPQTVSEAIENNQYQDVQIGILANEISEHKLFPYVGFVDKEDKDGLYGIKYENLSVVALYGVQQLLKRIEALENQIGGKL